MLKKALLLLILCSPAFAQLSPAYGNITAQGSTCATANACITLHLPSPNVASIGIQATGTFSLTAQVEGSQDNGATWGSVQANPLPNGTPVTSFTGTGNWVVSGAGLTDIRVRCSAFSSGTLTAILQPSFAVPVLSDVHAIAGIGASTVTAADSIANTAITSLTSAIQPLWVGASIWNGTTWDRLAGDTKGLQVHGTRNGINCLVAVSTATTIQAVGGSCVAPGAGLSIYITDIEFGTSAAAGTAADSFPTLKSGTGGTCGSGTAVIWQGLTAANSTIIANLSTPIKVASNSEVCWIMTTAGSKTVQVHGFIAP